MTTSQQNRERSNFIYLLGFIFLLVYSTAGAVESGKAEKSADPEEKLVELSFEVTKSNYEYQIENRPDPFIPFFTGKTKTEPTIEEMWHQT